MDLVGQANLCLYAKELPPGPCHNSDGRPQDKASRHAAAPRRRKCLLVSTPLRWLGRGDGIDLTLWRAGGRPAAAHGRPCASAAALKIEGLRHRLSARPAHCVGRRIASAGGAGRSVRRRRVAGGERTRRSLRRCRSTPTACRASPRRRRDAPEHRCRPSPLRKVGSRRRGARCPRGWLRQGCGRGSRRAWRDPPVRSGAEGRTGVSVVTSWFPPKRRFALAFKFWAVWKFRYLRSHRRPAASR